jgi:tetratricopeptide (TPR) repeat protein
MPAPVTLTRLLAVLLIAVLALGGCATLVEVTIDELIKQGIELFTARRYDEAIAKFLEVVRRDPKQWTAYLYMARSYIAKADWSNALGNARQAFQLAPSSGDVLPALAEALLGAGLDAVKRGQFPTAIGHLTEYIKLRPTDANAYLQLGRAYLSTNAWSEALRALVQGLAQSPDANTRGQLVRSLLDGGTQALTSGNAKGAIGLLQEYVRHDAGNVSAYVNLGKAYWQDGSLTNAMSAFQRVLQLSPNNAEALQFLRGR